MNSFLKEHRFAVLLVAAPCLLHAYLLSRPHEVDVDFVSGAVDPLYVTRIEGWQITPSGLAAMGDHARLDIAFWKFRFEDLSVRVQTTEQGRGKVRADILVKREAKLVGTEPPPRQSGPAWNVRLCREDQNLDMSPLVRGDGTVNLSRHWTSSGTCGIFITNADKATGPLIKSILLRRSGWSMRWFVLPFFYSAIYLVFRYVASFSESGNSDFLLIGTSVAIVFLQVVFPNELLDWAEIVLLLCLALSLAPVIWGRATTLPVVPILGCLLALAAFGRFDALFESRVNPLDPDAATFIEIARSMNWLVDTQIREPLFIWMVKLVTFVGNPESQLRLMTVFLSIALVGVAYWCGREVQGPIAGLVTALFVACSDSWSWQAPRGLRIETFSVGLLLLTALIWTRSEWPRTKHAVWMGIIAACICLLRITSAWFCLLGIAYGIYRKGWNTKLYALAVAITLVPLIPSYVYWSVAYGDPFHATNIHIRFYRNLEFQGQPGMPTVEQVAENATVGPPVTPTEFFFEQHSLFDLASRSVTQLQSTFVGHYLRDHVCSGSNAIAWCIIIGYGIVALTDRRMLLIWMAMLLGPIAWLYGPMSGPEWRLVFHISVFCFLCVGISIDRLANATGLCNQGR